MSVQQAVRNKEQGLCAKAKDRDKSVKIIPVREWVRLLKGRGEKGDYEDG